MVVDRVRPCCRRAMRCKQCCFSESQSELEIYCEMENLMKNLGEMRTFPFNNVISA